MRNTDESKAEGRTKLALRTTLVLLVIAGLIAIWYWGL